MINLKDKITIINLAPWVVAFKRLITNGDVVIPPKGRLTISSEEVMAQIYNRNKLFVGDDGVGSHARIYIDDKDVRIEALFDSEDGSKKQNILLEDDVKSMFELKTLSTFKKHVKDRVESDAEKLLIIELAEKFKINDYDKIKYLEEYTGYKIK
jgi:hypothetical protein